MAIEDFFNEKTIIDLSFFNFRNAVTAAYFANEKLEVQKVNGTSDPGRSRKKSKSISKTVGRRIPVPLSTS